ncbi:MAG: DUF4867 family protein [Lachnospiraceae bacterium]|jgi:hypothetical protein|nr:DUF4867 family protein [Lachnospiraceae bacterium]
MKIYSVTDERFGKYGKVIEGIDFSGLVKAMEETPCPDDVVYVPGDEKLEALPVMKELAEITYGELPIQIGYCNGHNCMLNALEYHRSSEVNVAATDAVLMLGSQQDITKDFTYDTSKVEAFLVPAGVAVEVYATTLHYAPCGVDGAGFKVAIVLPKGTNLDLDREHKGGEDGHLTAKNKWLLGHPEGGLPEGSPMGLIGKNLNCNE